VQQVGYTALHGAAERGYLSLVQLLVERTPQLLELTARVSGKMLLCAYVMCGRQNGMTPMHDAAYGVDVPILEVLCKHAPDECTLEVKTNVRLSVFVCVLPPSRRWWGGSMDRHRSTLQHSGVTPLL
jgi:hypothetical protein